jgi:hypothetical protein
MAENKLADLSTEFAVKILNLTDAIKGHYLATQVRLQVRRKQVSFQHAGDCGSTNLIIFGGRL